MGIFVWAAVALASIGAQPGRIAVRFFDMITVAVPPALPACLTIAQVFSIGRLKQMGIYVTGPHTITLAGQLDIVCFDKTGGCSSGWASLLLHDCLGQHTYASSCTCSGL
jgi:cation-transporting ATPase 13A3/4/5